MGKRRNMKANEKVQKGKTSAAASSVYSGVPRASDLQGAAVTSRTTLFAGGDHAQSEPEFHIYSMKYCTDGEVYGQQFEGPMLALHCLYFLYPSILFGILVSMKNYLQELKSDDASEPGTLAEFEGHYSCKIVITSPVDKDGVGTYVKYRVVFYVDAKKEKDLYLFLDGWAKWRLTNPVSQNDPELPETIKMVIHVPQDSQLAFNETDEMENEYNIVKEDFSSRVHVFQGHPPSFPPRPVIANVEAETRTMLNIVFSGNTKPFADLFDLADIGKKKGAPLAGEQFPEWYRVMRGRDLSIKGTTEGIIDLFQGTVLKNTPTFIRIVKLPENDEYVKPVIDGLKALPCVYMMT